MSATETIVRARIDFKTKQRATAVLSSIGLNVSDAIRLLMMRIAAEKSFPFELKVPNKTILRAMKELKRGKGKKFRTKEALFKDLEI